jgi:cyclohexanecarboxylate-CoA ligase/acyl-CoA synthetase
VSTTVPDAWDETLRDLMTRLAREAASRPAIVGAGPPISFAALHTRALALAAGFRGLGLGPGDIIAAQLPNSPEFIICYLAAGYIGATLQTIHMPYRGAEIETLLAHSRARAAVCLAQGRDASPAEIILSRKKKLPHLKHVIAVGPPAAETLSFAALAATQADESALPRVAASDRFLLLYTSGTTAAPKGVPVDYRRFLFNAARSAAALEIDGSSVLLSAAPFTHLYGLFSVNLALTTGAATAIMPPFTPGALAAALDACRPTALFCAPAHMSACLNEGLLTRERLASLKFLQISGSHCPPALAHAVQDLMPDGKVAQLWGMSELQAGAFTRPGDSLAICSTTAGSASPGTELRIANDETPLPANTEGELQVRGASVFSGYLDNAEATAAAFTLDGWFRTGDLARLDAAGNLQITGRLKDVINRGGVKFNAADIETIIATHGGVAQCAIVPMPDQVLGERACCFLVLKPGASVTLDDLRAFLSARDVAKLKWPERIEIVADMPMTPTRKVKKTELMKLL